MIAAQFHPYAPLLTDSRYSVSGEILGPEGMLLRGGARPVGSRGPRTPGRAPRRSRGGTVLDRPIEPLEVVVGQPRWRGAPSRRNRWRAAGDGRPESADVTVGAAPGPVVGCGTRLDVPIERLEVVVG